MKKILTGLCAGLMLATGAQALAYGCADGACTLPDRQQQTYCYGYGDGYCDGDRAPQTRGGYGCGCYRGR